MPAFVVVGVGASAGGLEAYAQLLRAIPPDIGMVFVLVQHMAPQHDSILPELLRESTEIPVVQATEGTTMTANRVYVAPPNAQVAIIDGKLHLVPQPEERGGFLPIDFFFRSLAEYAQGRAVGIVL